MGYLSPTEEQLAEFTSHPHAGRIWMWNLLRFADEEGRASYQRYGEAVRPLVEKRGGRIVLRARGQMTLIGPERWDEALVIEYPSRSAFLDMVTSEEYRAISHLRQDGIVDSRLYMTSELSVGQGG